MTDRELLERYVRDGSKDDMCELVRRHAGMVHTAAMREVRDAHLADDVTQAVFLVLMRRAASLSGHGELAGWLFQTTRFVAADARKQRARREQEVMPMNAAQEPSAAAVDRELQEQLNHAIGRLGTADREVVVRRYLEGQSSAEVAAALKTTEQSTRMRLSRAIEKLRKILGRKGTLLAAGVLIAGMERAASRSAAAALITQLESVIVHGAAPSAAAHSLAQGALRMILRAKFKAAAMIGSAVAAVTALLAAPLVMAQTPPAPPPAPAAAAVPVTSAPPTDSPAPAFSATGYTLINLGTFGGKTSAANAINASGEVVGSADLAGDRNHGFLFSEGHLIDLGTLGGRRGNAYGINDAGQVVGEADTDDPAATSTGRPTNRPPTRPTSHAFLYQDGKMKDLGLVGPRTGASTRATGINKAGQVAGESNATDLVGPGALLYSDGKTQDLGRLFLSQVQSGSDTTAIAINDAGDVVGDFRSRTDGRPRAFVFHEGKFRDLNDVVGQDALAAAHFQRLNIAGALNAAGQIIGIAESTSGAQGRFGAVHGFLFSENHLVDLGTMGRDESRPAAINATGEIVGSAIDASKIATDPTGSHAFLYRGGSMEDLNALVGQDTLAAAGFKILMTASGINDHGQIVGEGVTVEGNRVAYLLSPDSVKSPPPPTRSATNILELTRQDLQTALGSMQKTAANNKGGFVEKSIADLQIALRDTADAMDDAKTLPDAPDALSTAKDVGIDDSALAGGMSAPNPRAALQYLEFALADVQRLPATDKSGYRQKIIADIQQAAADTISSITFGGTPQAGAAPAGPNGRNAAGPGNSGFGVPRTSIDGLP